VRYWQMRAARLSTASQKLEADGLWHPMATTPLAWYRVGKGRVVQRVNFESDEEQETLFPLISEVDPLPDLASVAGFREELKIEMQGDDLFVVLPLGYAPANMEVLESTLGEYGIELRDRDTLLFAYVPLITVDRAELIRSQSVLTSVRLFYQAVLKSTALSEANAAVHAFRTSIEAIDRTDS
jgi:hypothetical protein